MTTGSNAIDSDRPPFLPLKALDTLWFQVAGTLCNLRCNHCFISCSPENHTLGLMSFDQFKPYLDEAVQYGVKEFYFTGGEPFINPEIFEILEATLAVRTRHSADQCNAFQRGKSHAPRGNARFLRIFARAAREHRWLLTRDE